MNAFTKSVVEQAALDWFRALGYNVVGGPGHAARPARATGELRGTRSSPR